MFSQFALEEKMVGNSGYYFITWLCRLTKMVDGNEIWNHLIHFLFVVLIILWLYNLILLLRWMCHLFGIRMSLWSLCCVSDVCFLIGCLQRITFFVVELLVMIHDVRWRLRFYGNFCSFILICNNFEVVWYLIYRWLGTSSVILFM